VKIGTGRPWLIGSNWSLKSIENPWVSGSDFPRKTTPLNVSQLAPVNFRSTVPNHRKSDGSGLDKIVSDEATPFLKLGAGAGVFHCLHRKIWQILQGGAP
jgi:hypothetical protein